MRIFVYEHVTGGGMPGESPGAGLVHEADLMLRTLLRDLGDVPGVSCLTTRDPRLPPIRGAALVSGEGPEPRFEEGLMRADAVWPTAPETGGCLERLARAVVGAGRTHLGSRPEAIHLAASKYSTARTLGAAGIAVVPTYRVGDAVASGHGGQWVTKPDDGAGADDIAVVDDLPRAERELGARAGGYILQPWIEGEPLSLSLLCANGEARVLSCNRQRVRLERGRVMLAGIAVNGAADHTAALAPLASAIAAAVPGLWGYVGVDLLLTATGPMVLEINPRLTTSWCGLREALGANPAQWVIDLARGGRLPDSVPRSGRVVELLLEAAHAG